MTAKKGSPAKSLDGNQFKQWGIDLLWIMGTVVAAFLADNVAPVLKDAGGAYAIVAGVLLAAVTLFRRWKNPQPPPDFDQF